MQTNNAVLFFSQLGDPFGFESPACTRKIRQDPSGDNAVYHHRKGIGNMPNTIRSVLCPRDENDQRIICD